MKSAVVKKILLFVLASMSPSLAASAQTAAPVKLAQATAPAAGAKSNEVVARVGETEVTSEELRSFIGGLSLQEQASLVKDTASLSQAVRQLLVDRLVLNEAVKKNWDQQQSVIAQLARLREKALTELFLQSVSTPPGSYPSDAEVQKTFDANRSVLIAPRQFQLRQIYVAEPKNADKAVQAKAKERIEEFVRKLKDGDFATVASAGNDAPNGGELGWVAESQLRPEISSYVIGMTKGALSDPIKLDDGYHLIKLFDTKAAHPLTLAEVRDQLVQQMRVERAASLRRAYLAQLLKQHPPVINELALSKLFDSARR